jgi:D-glycero-D-manno-heptose 1,7-bisphosphate phosphatase
MMRAAFLDRDGVINRRPPEGQYVTRWEELQILPGVPEAIALLTQAGFCVLTVSNQRCVAKGLLTAAELESIHKRMCQDLAAQGADITEVYYCPHELEPPCGCRKPAPGMLLTAACAHQIDLSTSWMIGDSDIDIEAGRKAGCRTVRIVTGDEVPKEGADLLAPSLLEAVQHMMELEAPAPPPDRQARKLVR